METRIIKFGDQDWKVTPFHCVVGPILQLHWEKLQAVWSSWDGRYWNGRSMSVYLERPPFVYVHEWRREVESLRKLYEGDNFLFFTNNPLVVNEMQPEEVTLACIDNGKLVLTNFRDIAGFEDRSKVYALGELWLFYAMGGNEPALRFGGPRP